jgi:putative transposase
VNVIAFAVHLHQLCFEIDADLGENMSQLLDSLAVEGAATVFGHKDQMDVHSKNAMSTVPKVVDVHHRPEYRKAMLRLQAYKFELMPNGEQVRMMRRFAGSCRFVYNKGLALNKERYEKKEKRLGYAGLCALLPAWKIEHPFLSDVPAQALQQALKNLERAYINFFKKRADFPKFHKKGQRNGFRIPQGFEVDNANGRIQLPKLGWMRYRKSQDVLGEAANISVSESCGKWFASIQTEREVERPKHSSNSCVGLDWGVARFFTLSDGQYENQLAPLKAFLPKLAKLQRRLAHKKKFSSNWKKAKARITKVHSKIANIRKDFVNKASNNISKNHAVVCIEDLQIQKMSASAAGTKGKPGKNVRAKSGLNRSILDASPFALRRQLEYKTMWRGGLLVPVPPQNTSRFCPCCEHVSKDNRKSQTEFVCVECGFSENADLVGAINIKRLGIASLVCSSSSGEVSPSWQKPTESIHAEARN